MLPLKVTCSGIHVSFRFEISNRPGKVGGFSVCVSAFVCFSNCLRDSEALGRQLGRADILSDAPACLPACLSAYLSVCLPVCVSASLLVCLSVCLSACLPICLFACLPVCLSSPSLLTNRGQCCGTSCAGCWPCWPHHPGGCPLPTSLSLLPGSSCPSKVSHFNYCV